MSAERASPSAPERIGPYRILDTLGEGGMGTVHLAEQSAPVKRRVALKLIKLGMDSKAVVARFEQERQALALMDHEGIAKVFDCGTSDRGQPFFVMELVKGVPLTEYCDRNRLSLPQRIGLMQQVCDAVQHAHQKGVVHRDLKPGNVLVAEEAGKPRIKIIDFGLAKAMGQKLVEATLFTEAGQVVGTPEYMAPEQADPTNQDIDTRADVYSLGVMLYEVLTGQLPFSAAELRRVGLLEMQRVLREVDPPKPSTKLSSIGASATAIAEQRRIGTGALLKALRSDLDWLALKSLEKDRARRYETANALKMDLQRFLDHEPLVAGPPSAAYRLRKLVRRYRGQVLAGGLVFAALLAGGIGTFVQYRKAKENEVLNARLAQSESSEKSNAIRERQRADGKVHEFNQLAGSVLYDRAIAKEAKLWPPWPKKTAEMERWLKEDVGPLLAMHPEIRKAITALEPPSFDRSELLAMKHWPPRVRDQDSAILIEAESSDVAVVISKNDQEELRRPVCELGFDFDFLPSLPGIWLAVLDADSQRQVAKVRLDTPSQKFLRETLDGLLPKLEQLTNVKMDVERRLFWAKHIEPNSLAHPNARHTWEAVRAAIAASPSYQGQEIELRDDDVIGLVPIGENPVTKLWEFYELRSAWDGVTDPRAIEIPRHRPDGSIEVKADTGIVFALLPGGVFTMGAQTEDQHLPNYDPDARSDEMPMHQVALQPFLMSRYELTQGQWARLWSGEEAKRHPSYYKAGVTYGTEQVTLAHPVEQVDWRLCNDLLRQNGMCLPTEAQWEFACRAGTTTPWWCNQGDLNRSANLYQGDEHAVHAPVGSYAANAFGLHDTLGNVWEWCADEYGPYRGDERTGDGLRPTGNGSADRCDRGGGFVCAATSARCTMRNDDAPVLVNRYLGVRAARNLKQ